MQAQLEQYPASPSIWRLKRRSKVDLRRVRPRKLVGQVRKSAGSTHLPTCVIAGSHTLGLKACDRQAAENQRRAKKLRGPDLFAQPDRRHDHRDNRREIAVERGA